MLATFSRAGEASVLAADAIERLRFAAAKQTGMAISKACLVPPSHCSFR
jgi:hypothetical protein